jgi:septum formation topological specificity factor MinE
MNNNNIAMVIAKEVNNKLVNIFRGGAETKNYAELTTELLEVVKKYVNLDFKTGNIKNGLDTKFSLNGNTYTMYNTIYDNGGLCLNEKIHYPNLIQDSSIA